MSYQCTHGPLEFCPRGDRPYCTLKGDVVECETCGAQTRMLGTRRCDGCWEVERRLPAYLKTKGGLAFVLKLFEAGPTKDAIRVINGLLKIAAMAMSDTYFATDRRVVAAKKFLRRIKGQK